MKLTDGEKELIIAIRSMGGEVVTFEEIKEKAKKLKEEFDELRRYKSFMDNHPVHEIKIKSSSDEKYTSFKATIPKVQMKQIAKYLMERNLDAQNVANEQIAKYKGGIHG
jgi:hypothetical protein